MNVVIQPSAAIQVATAAMQPSIDIHEALAAATLLKNKD